MDTKSQPPATGTSTTSYLETWYATWPSSGAITITINTNSTHSAAVVFGISGANTASPFDITTPSSSTGTGLSASTTITTSNANDFIIGTLGVDNGTTPTLTKAIGFNLVATQFYSGYRGTSDEYKIVSTTQSNLSVGYILSASPNWWGIIADAVKAAPP